MKKIALGAVLSLALLGCVGGGEGIIGDRDYAHIYNYVPEGICESSDFRTDLVKIFRVEGLEITNLITQESKEFVNCATYDRDYACTEEVVGTGSVHCVVAFDIVSGTLIGVDSESLFYGSF